MAPTMGARGDVEGIPDLGAETEWTAVLIVKGLSVRYGRSVRALEDVDVEVADDAVLAVLGGNGAGKSTLLRAISGTLKLHRGTAGEITFEGERIDRLDPALVVRRASSPFPRDARSSPG